MQKIIGLTSFLRF